VPHHSSRPYVGPVGRIVPPARKRVRSARVALPLGRGYDPSTVDQKTEFALRAAQGDRIALDAWIERCYPPVWRYCAMMTGTELAEELAQDTFERALRALPKFRANASVTTWLIGIARHVCIDRLREDRRRDYVHQHLAALTQPGRHGGDAASRIRLLEMIHHLEPDRREAFVLTQLLGFSYQETANICSCPIGTIRSRVARARADLLADSDTIEERRTPRHTGTAD
jgi:RNA polymerase sigma-70 factor, ECF subfamily